MYVWLLVCSEWQLNCKLLMNAFKQIECPCWHVFSSAMWRPNQEWKRLKLKHAQQLTSGLLQAMSQLRIMTSKLCGRLLTDVWTVAEVTSGKDHAQTTLINDRDSVWLGVKLTPCKCSHSSLPNWQQTVHTNPHCCHSWFVYHDLNEHALLAQAHPTMIKYVSS